MTQEFKTVTTNDGEKITSVDELLQKIGELEEKAYVTGVKETLQKLHGPLRSLSNMLERVVSNIESTLAMDNLVNKEAVPPKVDGPALVED